MKLSTEIFESEGKHNVRSTIRIVAKAATKLEIEKVVVLAASAQNVLELRKTLSKDCHILAVTFPAGMMAMPDSKTPISMGIPSREDRLALRQNGIPICQGVMPLRALGENVSPIVDAMQRVLGLFGGGVELCVQAVLMACDAGYLIEGERCIVMSADTALVMRAGNAFRFLKPQSRAAVEHILCKPLNYQISRKAATPPVQHVNEEGSTGQPTIRRLEESNLQVDSSRKELPSPKKPS